MIQAAGTDDDKARLLPALAEGSSIATVAATGSRGTWAPDGVAVQAVRHGDGHQLTGAAHYVLDGQIADVIIVVAKADEGIAIFEVAPDAAGFDRTAATVFDATVRLSTFTFDRTPARRIGTGGWAAVEHALSLTVIALAGEQVGGARHLFDVTVEYLKTRIQFGRPIGSFQAIKHMAADLLLEVESATSAAQHAAAQFDTDPTDADGAVALAGFACAEAYHTTAMQSIQMHGGIGFTWEHDAHLYLRRALTLSALTGDGADPLADVVDGQRTGRAHGASFALPEEAAEYRTAARDAVATLRSLTEDKKRDFLVDSGYLVPHWPKPWGRDAGVLEQLVIEEEFRDVERPDLGITGWVTLTIAQAGTDDQRERWVYPVLRGEIMWCQLFSNPGRLGRRRGAHQRQEGRRRLAGDRAEGVDQPGPVLPVGPGHRPHRSRRPKHAGVTMMAIDMKAPGVTVNPSRA